MNLKATILHCTFKPQKYSQEIGRTTNTELWACSGLSQSGANQQVQRLGKEGLGKPRSYSNFPYFPLTCNHRFLWITSYSTCHHIHLCPSQVLTTHCNTYPVTVFIKYLNCAIRPFAAVQNSRQNFPRSGNVGMKIILHLLCSVAYPIKPSHFLQW